MSREYYRRGRNWYSAIGALFCVMGAIVLVQQLFIWGAEFVVEFLTDGTITNEKVSVAMIAFGTFMIIVGFFRHEKR